MFSISKELDRFKKGLRAINLYRQFVRPGGLCFDIGANHGSRAAIFTCLGARTIALEPNAKLTGKLKHFPRVTVVNQAVAECSGSRKMLFNRNDQISSLNPDWRNNWPEFPEWEERDIECTTFDALIARYGLPDFSKIDVEGFEYAVLAGLSHPIPLLSFEASPGFAENTVKCLSCLKKLGDYEFNLAFGDDFQLVFPAWVGAHEVAVRVTAPADIYARLKKRH
jgi:FkbM family methyltransferase